MIAPFSAISPMDHLGLGLAASDRQPEITVAQLRVLFLKSKSQGRQSRAGTALYNVRNVAFF